MWLKQLIIYAALIHTKLWKHNLKLSPISWWPILQNEERHSIKVTIMESLQHKITTLNQIKSSPFPQCFCITNENISQWRAHFCHQAHLLKRETFRAKSSPFSAALHTLLQSWRAQRYLIFRTRTQGSIWVNRGRNHFFLLSIEIRIQSKTIDFFVECSAGAEVWLPALIYCKFDLYVCQYCQINRIN